ncbi:MAG TPA: adenylosuccinate lyase family protein [Bradyrhizobium sp.]|nr:adenylosuccinate lyase family protein [Bradyrhizobium sp.]
MTLHIPEGRASLAEIRAIFSPRSVRESWLEIEASLAEAQAELGIIPTEAALEIRSKANFDTINEGELAADIERTRAPIVSLVRALSRACSGDAGGYVHWGATTQNVVQTGRVLLMRRAHHAFMLRFDDVLLALAEMAEREAETITVARTNQRQALPVTFGFKVAGWIEEWLRHRQRFIEASPRIFCSQWGGAVGAMHAIGPLGPRLNERLSHRLNLTHAHVPSRAAQDGVAEYVALLGLFGATCAKLARNFYALMADEIEEVVEELGENVVGSSTMPHKINSKIAVHVIAISARLRSFVQLAFEAMQPTHEGDAASSLMIAPMIDEVCPLAYEMVDQMLALLTVVRLRPEKMRRNLDMTSDYLASENVMMTLAPIIGRTQAHDVVHHAIVRSSERGTSLADSLFEHGALPADISEHMIRDALDPSKYIGLSVSMARDMAALARRSVYGIHVTP